MEGEPGHSDSIHESVRRLLRWRYLVVAGVSVAAWVAIGSTSALAADRGLVQQSNTSSSTTTIDNNDGQSTGLIGGPIVAPVNLAVQTNASGPVNLNLLGSQAGSGNGGSASQSNSSTNTTVVDNRSAQSAGVIGGPVVAPVNVALQTNGSGPVNGNALGNQAASGNGAGGDVTQSNVNAASTFIDNSGAQSSGVVAGPIVAPISPQLATSVGGPVNGNVLANQRASGNANSGAADQVNDNSSFTWLDNQDAQSSAAGILGGVAGPIVVPVSPQAGTSLNGPLDLNGVSNQAGSGNGNVGDLRQNNVNSSFTRLDNQGAQSTATGIGPAGVAVAGPVVAPISPQLGTSVDGPVNGQLLGNQSLSGNGSAGSIEQINANRSATFLSNQGAQSTAFAGGAVAVATSGPFVIPVSPQVGTSANGPLNANAASNQRASGSGNAGDVHQGSFNESFAWVDNEDAQSEAAGVGLVGAGAVAASGPIVAPISPQVGTNVNGPANGSAFANQLDSGSGNAGTLFQVNGNDSLTFLDNRGAQSNSAAGSVGVLAGAGAVSGPIVAPISPQVGTGFNGPLNLNGASSQRDSGNGNEGQVFEDNLNTSGTWVDNADAQSNATALAGGAGLAGAGALAVSGPIVLPVSPQVGTSFNGPINGSLAGNQLDSGIANDGSATEVNANRSFTWLNNRGAQSNAAALAGAVGAFGGADSIAIAGPIVAPVAPQVGTNLNGPLDVNGGSNQAGSGDGANGDVHQLNWNSMWAGVDNSGAQSSSSAVAPGLGVVAGGEAGALAMSGPIVAPISPQVGTNANGPANADLVSNQLDSGNANAGTVDQLNTNESFAWLNDEGAQSDATAGAGDLTLLPAAGAAAGAVSGPVVVPVSPQLGTNLNGPADVTGVSNLIDSGSGGDVRQANLNGSWTGVDNRDVQSNAFATALLLTGGEGGAGAAAVAGPIVAPISPQIGTNVNGPLNGNVVSNALDSENGGTGPADMLNANRSFTWLDNEGAQSHSFASALAGSLGDAGAGSAAVAGPIVAPIAPQLGTNANGPVNVGAGSDLAGSGNGNVGDLHQLNWQSAWTGVDNRDAQSGATDGAMALGHAAGAGAVAVSGPVVVPVVSQVGTNLNGPLNGNLSSNQQDSGNGSAGDVWQANAASAFAGLDNGAAQSDSFGGSLALLAAGAGSVAVSGPIVVPVGGQVGTNGSGPANVNVAGDQLASGNGSLGEVRQLNWDGAWTWVDNQGAQSDAIPLAIAPVAGAASVSGPVLVPVNPQVGTNVNGPLDVNAASDQADSGNGNIGDMHQLNWSWSGTWLVNDGAQSVGMTAAGPIVAPISPQLGTNVGGPVNVNVFGNQDSSGNGSPGDISQDNANQMVTQLGDEGAMTESVGLSGPAVIPVKVDGGTNLDGPFDANGASNASDMVNAGAVRGTGPGGLAGMVIAAVAGLTALASIVATRRSSVR